MTVLLAENTWPCGFSLLLRLFCFGLDFVLRKFRTFLTLPAGSRADPAGKLFVFAERPAVEEGNGIRHDFARLRLRFFLLYLTYDTNYKKRKYFLSRGSANRS